MAQLWPAVKHSTPNGRFVVLLLLAPCALKQQNRHPKVTVFVSCLCRVVVVDVFRRGLQTGVYWLIAGAAVLSGIRQLGACVGEERTY